MRPNEWQIEKILFYSTDDLLVNTCPEGEGKGRKYSFEIGPNEKLIGCELDHDGEEIRGITFIKWSDNSLNFKLA